MASLYASVRTCNAIDVACNKSAESRCHELPVKQQASAVPGLQPAAHNVLSGHCMKIDTHDTHFLAGQDPDHGT